MLEPKYLDRETEVAFNFDKNKLEHLKNYDIIIFDECSTISKELYSYIQQAYEYIEFKFDRKLKFIYLGDYWQLPPVGEDVSIIFNTAVSSNWFVSKLTKVMRSANELMYNINQSLLLWIDVFKSPNTKGNKKYIDGFHKHYPYNLLDKDDYSKLYINHQDDLLDGYMETWKTKKITDTIILTYSKANCEKNNFCIQDKIDMLAGRELPEKRKLIKFHAGDRCCMDKPIEVCKIKYIIKDSENYVILEGKLGQMLYNGEIFDIIHTEDVKCITPLNKYEYISKYFDAQILSICRIDDPEGNIYKIIHCENDMIEAAKKKLRSKTSRSYYLGIVNPFIKYYPKLDYGYCITIYKSQGSEWNTVFINLNSIKYSIVGDTRDSNSNSNTVTFIKKKGLFRTTYTAITRASHNVKLFWF
jgi:hypothetical protein